jgi:hypothetical protein
MSSPTWSTPKTYVHTLWNFDVIEYRTQDTTTSGPTTAILCSRCRLSRQMSASNQQHQCIRSAIWLRLDTVLLLAYIHMSK